ncbi:MAG: PDZ domain-containing protein, partial [Pirellulaceae bacterium]|nr:PDZ domain-containing protein [Pirellulaceae bacterium]
MKLPVPCYIAVLMVTAWPLAALPAQEQPANPKIKEYEQSLEKIHAQASNVNRWHSTQSTLWSEKQCRSCHVGTHALVKESQLLLSRVTIANPLGVETVPLDGTLRAHLNIDKAAGLVLTSAPEGSEGAKAGLKAHDIVLNIDQQLVNDPAKFNELVGGLQGKKANIGLLRGGKPLVVEVAIPQLPLVSVLERDVSATVFGVGVDDRFRIGVTLSEADDTLRSHLKLATGEGLVVTEVVDGSPAAKMGVKQHDVLIELDGKRLTSIEAVNAQIQEVKEKTVLLKLLRSGQEVTCQISPQKSSEPTQRAWTELVLVDGQDHHPAI